VAAAAAYAESTCTQTGPFTGPNSPDLTDGNPATRDVVGACPFPVNFGDSNYFQAGLYIQHVPTGLWALGNYGDFQVDGVNDSSQTWYVKAGIRQRWHPLGHTVLYGEYQHNDDGGALSVSPCAANSFTGSPGVGASCDAGNFTNPTSSESFWWGAGVVQEIDAAAMSLWLRWRQTSYEDNSTVSPDGVNFFGTSYDDVQEITFGGLINF
jgi:hypothetical protein